MRWLLLGGLALSYGVFSPSLSQTHSTRPLQGFSDHSSTAQRALEARFDAGLSKENLRDWMQWMTAKPHHLGSPFGREVAEFIAAKFRGWGYETGHRNFRCLYFPRLRRECWK
jgi:N-acetylated-alpha-linked acidic dipeptidase